MNGLPQFDDRGRLRHLLTLEGLDKAWIERLLTTADAFVPISNRQIKTVPLLRGYSVFNLFFENSTRTLTTFEIAAKRLSADVVNLNIRTSSTSKGESLLDTLDNLCAMQADLFVVRHADAGASYLVANHLAQRHQHDVAVINAGDGCHQHPTQGLLDLYTMRHFKGRLDGLVVAIIGDIRHSRVARANVAGLKTMGAQEIRLIAPGTLAPAAGYCDAKVRFFRRIEEGLPGCDVVMLLRLQKERMDQTLIPSMREYFKNYSLTPERLALAKPDAIVMHPGPMNRGVEIDSAVANGTQSVIFDQVTFGIAIRMAAMSLLLGRERFES